MFARHLDEGSQARRSGCVSTQLQIRSLREGDTHVVALAGELDLGTAQDLEDELARVEATDPPKIVLDLRDLRLVDSSGMAVVIRASARSDRARLNILRGPDSVHRPFELSGLAARLPFVEAPPP